MQRIFISILLAPALMMSAGCGGDRARIHDDTGAFNAFGGASRSGDYSRFGGGIVTELRQIPFPSLKGGILSPPLAVAADRSAIVAEGGKLALVTRDSLLWVYDYPQGERPIPVVAADSSGIIYSVSTNGTIRALSGEGTLVWEGKLPGADDSSGFAAFTAPVALPSGFVAGTTDGFVARYDGGGKELWRIRRGGSIGSLPAAGAEGVAVTVTQNDFSQSDTLLLLDPATGATRRSMPIPGGRIIIGPTLLGDLLVVGGAARSESGGRSPFVVAFTKEGKQAWRVPLLFMPRGISGDDQGNIYISGSGTGREITGGEILSLDHAGKERWRQAFESAVPAPAAVGADYIYFVARRAGTTGLYTYSREGALMAFLSIDVLPDVHAEVALTSFGDIVLAGLDFPALLEGNDTR